MSKLQRRLGTTMVYVTHDQTEAMTLGDRLAVMRSGIMQQVGSPHELYENPLNLLHGRLYRLTRDELHGRHYRGGQRPH